MESTPLGRLKVLRAMWRTPHRYDRLRVATMSISIGTLLVVPFSGLARVDLWAGQHEVLFRPAPFKHGLAGVIVGIAAMYVVTFLANVLAGRLFCGWGCPVGQISRFGDATSLFPVDRAQRARAHVEGAAFSAAFILAMMAWWVDLRVLWQGAPIALAWSWGVLVAGIVASYLHGRLWRWRFCTNVCPIGLYYSFVSPAKWFGIHFDQKLNTCIDCDACDNACPVRLAPRDLTAPIGARGGVSIADAPGRNHCLECGDCVRACEWILGKRGLAAPLSMGLERADSAAENLPPPPGCASPRAVVQVAGSPGHDHPPGGPSLAR